eukprot:scaffold6971_cov102-Skeletonema_dohrnii-CCMP3373.AAC.1
MPQAGKCVIELLLTGYQSEDQGAQRMAFRQAPYWMTSLKTDILKKQKHRDLDWDWGWHLDWIYALGLDSSLWLGPGAGAKAGAGT